MRRFRVEGWGLSPDTHYKHRTGFLLLFSAAKRRSLQLQFANCKAQPDDGIAQTLADGGGRVGRFIVEGAGLCEPNAIGGSAPGARPVGTIHDCQPRLGKGPSVLVRTAWPAELSRWVCVAVRDVAIAKPGSVDGFFFCFCFFFL